MIAARPSALLLDVDGVLRRFDPSVGAEIERRHGLGSGALLDALLAPGLLRAACVGEITDREWRARIADKLGAPEAVREWAAYRGEIDPDVLGFAREVRAAGRPVVLATNATDRLDEDLELLGLAGEFDAVVNSSVLGVTKPSREFYLAACDAAAVPPRSCLLVDDVERNVLGARAAGLYAHRWSGPADLKYLRAVLAPGPVWARPRVAEPGDM